jgi:hypothetical protein
VHLDIEVLSGFVECGVCCHRDNPAINQPDISSALAGIRATYISGSVIPFVTFAQSLCVLTDIIMDSVPPDVVVPAPLGLLYLKGRNKRNEAGKPRKKKQAGESIQLQTSASILRMANFAITLALAVHMVVEQSDRTGKDFWVEWVAKYVLLYGSVDHFLFNMTEERWHRQFEAT